MRDYVSNLNDHREDLERIRQELIDENVVIPEYYQREFHTYREGNLGWAPAFEADPMNLSVHSRLFVESDKSKGNVNGGYLLRSRFLDIVSEVVEWMPRRVLDMGCSTGFGTMLIQERFWDSEVVGVDLSSYMLAVARYKMEMEENSILETVGVVGKERKSRRKPRFVHGLLEDLRFEDGVFDVVCLTLTLHELPKRISKQIFKEAYRVLEDGGVFCVMDSDPARYKNRPPAMMALFSVSEPWITEFRSLDQEKELESCGFKIVRTKTNSPTHRTIVCRKP